MFTSKLWTDDSKLLQESNLTARQSRRAPHHAIQVTTSEELAQGPYVAARVEFKSATFRTEGTEHHHWATTPLLEVQQLFQAQMTLQTAIQVQMGEN